jgi:threonylcarbamoyladenosine tRNA methylthiotransferase MtaB
MTRSTTFRVLTFGCKVNQYESELIREQLTDGGLAEQEENTPADLYVVNTCTVTVNADAKCRKSIRHIARDNPNARIVVTGCYAERDAETLATLPNVEAVIGNRGKENLVQRVVGDTCGTALIRKSIAGFEDRTRAFIKIQDGCDKYCSYCIVPYVRGEPRSRRIEEIVQEAKVLVENGYIEIVLTGIHIGCFGRTKEKMHALPDLIRKLEGIDALCRVRLSSIDPNEINDELISTIRESPVACNHLHISLQSGSTAILKAMRRNYTAEDYLRLTENLYRRIPDISISTDVMVGFPGETDQDFEKSRELVEKVRFSKVHIFPFSPREGTTAAKMQNTIDPRTACERGALLASVSQAAAAAHREKFIGRTMAVLIEEASGRNEYEGFTENYLRTSVASQTLLLQNDLVQVRTDAFDHKYLYGTTVKCA